MNYKAEKKLTKLLQGEFPPISQLKQWFLKQFPNSNNTNDNYDNEVNCTLEEFAIYFLNEVKQYTEMHLTISTVESEIVKPEAFPLDDRAQQETETLATPKKLTPMSTSTPCKSNSKLFALVSPNNQFNTSNSMRQQHNLKNDQRQQQRRYSSTPPLPSSPSSLHKNRNSSLCLGDFIGTPVANRQQKKRMLQSNNKIKNSYTNESFNLKENNKDTDNKNSTYISNAVEKPKKRVAPTTIKPRCIASNKLNTIQNISVFTGESSFSNDDNFLQLADVLEIEDKEQCAILEARKILKTNPQQISKELANVNDNSINKSNKMLVVQEQDKINFNRSLLPIDIDNNVKNSALLKKLAQIYSVLIDLNITTNVLSELSYMINLCNANCITETTASVKSDTTISIRTAKEEIGQSYIGVQQSLHDLSLTQVNSINYTSQQLFSNLLTLPEAMYFISQVLSMQRYTIAQLDTESLNIILNSNFCHYHMTDDMKEFLLNNLQYKLQLQTQKGILRKFFMEEQQRNTFSNVYFQEDNNSREHFTSTQEFSNFRSQRDLFYKCFNIWQANHLNPLWNFSVGLTPIIKDIFYISENSINMIHFAKLFVSQLLISAINVAPTPREIGLDDVTGLDQNKLQKLSQRLTAPGKFSRDYQFPRMESFFQQFIAEVRSLAFLEQLKMELYSELLMRNNCSLNHINIYDRFLTHNYIDNDIESLSPTCCHIFYNYNYKCNYYIVKHDDMRSLLLLAKFLGYVMALPYLNVTMNKDGNNGNNNCCGTNHEKIPIEIEKNQIHLRNMMQCKFETTNVLIEAMQNGKLLITLPWLIQYYVMLDNVALKLDYNVKTLRIIFGLYMAMGLSNNQQQHIGHHDNHKEAEKCKEHQTTVAEIENHTNNMMHNNTTAIFIIRVCLGWLFEEQHTLRKEYYSYRAMAMEYNNEMEIINKALAIYEMPERTLNTIALNNNFDCILETMLITICPFLAEFRVSIIPTWSKLIKNASRTGKYRYITPRLTQLPSTPKRQKTVVDELPANSQGRLIQAFLHSLNSNTRLLINFCTDRCYKSVVKDGHYTILLPSKRKANDLVDQIDIIDYHNIYREISDIYTKAKLDALKQWNSIVPQMLEERINNVLKGLLPEETCKSIVKKAYFYIIQQDSEKKINDWIHGVMFGTDFYCNSINNLANKICNSNKIKHQQEEEQKARQKLQVMHSSELHITQLKPCLSNLLEDLQYWLHCTSVRQERLKDLDAIQVLLEHLPLTFENPLPALLYQAIVINVLQLMKHIICSNKVQLSDEIIEAACTIWMHPKVQIALMSEEINVYDSLITISFIENVTITQGGCRQLEKLLIAMLDKQIVLVTYIYECFNRIFEHNCNLTVPQELDQIFYKIAKVYNENTIEKLNSVHLENDHLIHNNLR